MEFMFSSFSTFFKVLINVIFASIHTSFDYCNVALLYYENFKNMKFNVKYSHKGHKININFVRMILLYPHLKHKMPIDFLGWFLQYQMLGIKYACSMKKMVTIKNWKLKKKN